MLFMKYEEHSCITTGLYIFFECKELRECYIDNTDDEKLNAL